MNKFRYNLKKKQKKKYIAKHDPRKNFRDKKMYPAEEASAGSSATTKCSLRKKVLQDLPRVRGRQGFSAGSRGRSCRTFFRWITRKILQKLLPQESAEEPSTLLPWDPAEEHLLPLQFPEASFIRVKEGSSRGSTFVFNLQHHRSLMSSILRFLRPFTPFKQIRGG